MNVKKSLFFVLSFFTFDLWPVNLYLKNTLPDFISYVIPALLLITSYFLYSKQNKYYLAPILLIGIYEKKFAILPLIFCFFDTITNFKKETVSLLVVSLTIFFWQFTPYRGQTVFNRDYEGEQLLIRNIHIYPNIPMARAFQNKANLYLGKVTNNMFYLTDLNNYFFAGHPAPTTKPTQELYKFYWPLIIFLLIGIYSFKDIKGKNFVLISLISCLISLSLLNNYDRNDFILWYPIGLLITNGIKKIF
jgi:hypothetical protein